MGEKFLEGQVLFVVLSFPYSAKALIYKLYRMKSKLGLDKKILGLLFEMNTLWHQDKCLMR